MLLVEPAPLDGSRVRSFFRAREPPPSEHLPSPPFSAPLVSLSLTPSNRTSIFRRQGSAYRHPLRCRPHASPGRLGWPQPLLQSPALIPRSATRSGAAYRRRGARLGAARRLLLPRRYNVHRSPLGIRNEYTDTTDLCQRHYSYNVNPYPLFTISCTGFHLTSSHLCTLARANGPAPVSRSTNPDRLQRQYAARERPRCREPSL